MTLKPASERVAPSGHVRYRRLTRTCAESGEATSRYIDEMIVLYVILPSPVATTDERLAKSTLSDDAFFL